VRDSSKSVFLEAGALQQATSELTRHEKAILDDLSKHGAKIQSLEHENRQMRTSSEMMRKDSDNLKAQLKETQRLQDVSSAMITELEAEKAGLNEQIAQQQQHIIKVERLASDRQGLLTSSHGSVADLLDLLQQLVDALEKVGQETLLSAEEQAKVLGDRKADQIRLVDEVRRLEKQLVDRDQATLQLEKARDSVLSEVAKRQADLDQIRIAVTDASQVMRHECSVFERQLATTRNELIAEGADYFAQLAELHALAQRRQDANRFLEKEFSDTRADLEKQLAGSKDEVAKLTEVKAQHEAAIIEMRGKLDDKEKELAKTKEEFSDTRADLEKQLAGSKDEVAKLTEVKAQHEAAITEMRGKLDDKEKELAKTKEEFSDTQEEYGKLRADLEKQLAACQEEIAHLQIVLEDHRHKIADGELRFGHLQQELARAHEECSHTKSALELQLDTKENEIASLNEKLVVFTQQNVSCNAKMVNLEADLARTKMQLEANQQECKHMRETLTVSVEHLKADLLQMQQVMQDTQQNAMDKLKTALAQQHAEAQVKLQEAAVELAGLHESLELANQKLTDAKAAHYEELEATKKRYTMDMDAAECEHQQALAKQEEEALANRERAAAEKAELVAKLQEAELSMKELEAILEQARTEHYKAVSEVKERLTTLEEEKDRILAEGKAAAEQAKQTISKLEADVQAERSVVEQTRQEAQTEREGRAQERADKEKARAQLETLRGEFAAEREGLGVKFTEQLDAHDAKYSLLEKELTACKEALVSKDAEISALHTDFEERTEYIDELSKQKLAQQEAEAAGRIKTLEDDLDVKREALMVLKMELEGEREMLEQAKKAQAAAAERESEMQVQLQREKTRNDELVDEKRRASSSMHLQESQLLEHIAEIMTEQDTLKAQIESLTREKEDLTGSVAALRAEGEQGVIEHARAIADVEERLSRAEARAQQCAGTVRAKDEVLLGAKAEAEKLQEQVVDARGELRGAVEELGETLPKLLEQKSLIEQGQQSAEEELLRLTQQLEEERRRHLMREGELEDKMCETKIRMYQYRDESLQSLLGLDTMAELDDIICAIKAQQRESKNLRQLQMEMRRQILGDAENMVKLLTGCRVFESDLETMIRRAIEKRGTPEADPNFLESQLTKVLREFQRNLGVQRERAAMLLAFQSKQRNIASLERGGAGAGEDPQRGTPRSARAQQADMWGRSASDLKKTSDVREGRDILTGRDVSTPLGRSGTATGTATPLWSLSSANSPAHSRSVSRVASRVPSPQREREREREMTPSAFTSVSDLFAGASRGTSRQPSPSKGSAASRLARDLTDS
jgi:chromosome segregation ATPase